MNFRTASPLTLLAVFIFSGGCMTRMPATETKPNTSAPVFAASPNRIVGRVLAIDTERGFAFVDLAPDASPDAFAAGNSLITRTLDLRETGTLRASSYVQGKTLGARIVAGKPTPGDEVVWRAP